MPSGRLLFDEQGVAQDGTLEHEGVQLDMRSNGLVAILVSRAAIAPDAHPSDDDAVRRELMRALRMTRLWRGLAIALPLAWMVLLVAGIVNVASGVRSLSSVLVDVGGPVLVLAAISIPWWFDRRKLRKLES